ncbi:MAG: MAPEG family protein [Geminicoccaceae bacterium]
MIATIYASLLGLVYLAASWYLILLKRLARRWQNDKPLRFYDRASHGRDHLADYVPFGVVMLALLEYDGMPGWWLNLLGLLLLFGNLVHVYAFVWFPGDRRAGMIGMVLISAMYALACVSGIAAALQWLGERP